MAIISEPNPTWENRFNATQPIADKHLEPDGSITTLSGQSISGPNASLARRYAQASPIPDKWVNSDGSITSGNAGGSGGGGQIIQVADEATALAQSQANPNNFYFWV